MAEAEHFRRTWRSGLWRVTAALLAGKVDYARRTVWQPGKLLHAMHHLHGKAGRVLKAHPLAPARLIRWLDLGGVRRGKRVQVGRRCGAQAEGGEGITLGALDDHVVVLR